MVTQRQKLQQEIANMGESASPELFQTPQEELIQKRQELRRELEEHERKHPEHFQAPKEPEPPSNENIHGDATPKATLQQAEDKLPNNVPDEDVWFFPLPKDNQNEYDKLNERQKRYLKLIKIMRNKDDPPMEGLTLEEEKKLAQLTFYYAGIICAQEPCLDHMSKHHVPKNHLP